MTKSSSAVTINIRAKARQRDLIDRAAERLGRSRSEFMLDVACRHAEDVLLDQTFFPVDGETFAKLAALIEYPPEPSEALRRLMRSKAPWE